MPELIPAVPGSPEWLAARRTGVTATGRAWVQAHARHSDYLKRIAPKETDSE